jgi:hypothetical protein
MTLHLTRRAALFLPLLAAACGDDEPSAPVRADFPPLRYSYLPPINLNVQRVVMAGDFAPTAGDGEVGDPSMAETLNAMARDRLKPVGTGGVATFRILTASIKRHRDALDGVLTVRVDVQDADGGNTGFAEARATATHSGPISDLRATTYDMLKTMMDGMNVELEYQLRNKLRAWVVDPAAEPPAPVDPSAKPPPPAAPAPLAPSPIALPPPVPVAPPPPPA